MDVVYLDREHFDRVFKSHDPEKPDAWRRVAAVQFEVAYADVTQVQRDATKTLYYGYLYGMPPQEFEVFMESLKATASPTESLRKLMRSSHGKG